MILAVEKNTIDEKTMKKLEGNGYTVIECDNPNSIRVINPDQIMDSSDWFMAALIAVNGANNPSVQAAFVNELSKRMKAKEDKK